MGGANLAGATLGYAKLEGAHLWGAKLAGADLGYAKLEGADLWFAKLQGADLGGANLAGATLGYAKLEGADLWFAKLEGASLGYAKLQGASLWNAELEGADLYGAKLAGAFFCSIEQLASVARYAGATLPDSTQLPDDEAAAKQTFDTWKASAPTKTVEFGAMSGTFIIPARTEANAERWDRFYGEAE